MGVLSVFNLGPQVMAADGTLTNVLVKGPAIIRAVWREDQRDTVAAATVLASAKVGQTQIIQPCAWLADIWDPTSTGGKYLIDFPMGNDDIFSLDIFAPAGATISALVVVETPDDEERAVARITTRADRVLDRAVAAAATGGISELPALARRGWRMLRGMGGRK